MRGLCALERKQKGRLFGRPRILAGPIQSVGVGCAGRDARLKLVCTRSQGQVGQAVLSALDASLSYSGYGEDRATIRHLTTGVAAHFTRSCSATERLVRRAAPDAKSAALQWPTGTPRRFPPFA